MTIVVLALLGLGCLLAELVLPGGVIGIVGAICLIAAVALTFTSYGAIAGVWALIALIVLSIVITLLWMKHFHRLPLTRRLILDKAIDDNSEEQRLQKLIGREGVTLTQISPSGQIEVDDKKIDVLTESSAIEKGRVVRIVDARGPSIFVEEVA